MPTKNDKNKVTDTEKETEKKPLTQQLEKYAKRAKEKVHDMDTMLAQLVLLDTALEEKKENTARTPKASKHSRKKNTIEKSDKKKNKKDSKFTTIAGGIDGKSAHVTYSEEAACQDYFLLNRQTTKVGPSNIQNCGLASGNASVSKEAIPQQRPNFVASGRINAEQDIETTNQFSIEIETNDVYCLLEKSSTNCLQCHSSLSDCDAEKVVTRKPSKKQRKDRSVAKSDRKRRKHDYNYDEEALRRRLSLISIDSSNCETQTNLMKKENGDIPTSDNVYVSKTEATMKKSRRSSNELNESSDRRNSVTEDIQAVNEDETENNDVKHDPNKAYASQQQRSSIKLPADIGLEAERAKLVTETDKQLPNTNTNLELSSKHSKKMERKVYRNNEDDTNADLPSRVIVVKNPRIKSRKKQKSKSADNLKRLGKQKEDQTQSVYRPEEQITRYKEAKKERKEKSSKTKSRKKEIVEVPSQYSATKDASQQQRILLKQKQRKKAASSDEDNHVIIISKTKHQQSKSNYEVKPSAKSAYSEQKQDQDKRRNSQETSAKYITKRASEKELWFNIKTIADDSNQVRSSRALKKNDKSKTPVVDEDDKKTSSKTKKFHRAHRRMLASKEKSNEGVRLMDAVNWHTSAVNVYEVSGTVRPESRGWKANALDKTNYGSSPPKHVVRLASSSESDVKLYSSDSSTSHDSALSSASQSSTDHSDLDDQVNVRHRHADKYSRSDPPSIEVNNKTELTVANAIFNRHRNRPQRSASSTSSFQRYPCHIIDIKAKPKSKHTNNDQAMFIRYENKVANSGNKAEDNDSPPSSPNENLFEPKFGKRRNKRPNVSIVAEGEDGNSPWQHQQLVVVSQKPGALSTRKAGTSKALQQSKQTTGNFTKNISGGSDKRPQTIRDLYSLHNVLSDTQNGTVISGYRRNDGVRVAIKRISKAATSRWGKMNSKTVPLELALLCQVNESRCSGVVQVVEWHETNEAYLLVMIRPHPVVDLYDYVTKHKRIKESLARHIIRQLVSALYDCIKCGVLHRDVKLENILFNPETMDITLIDFGCGDYVRTTPYKEFAGTPEYYPPEWFARKQYNAEPMTTWSIGVLLYSLLCGTLPFRSSVEIREKDANKFPSDVSRSARDLVGLLLQKNPRERLGMSELFDHPWLSKFKKVSS